MNANHRNALVAIAVIGLVHRPPPTSSPTGTTMLSISSSTTICRRLRPNGFRHDASGHVRRGQLDRAQIPAVSRAASGGGERLERGSSGRRRRNSARRFDPQARAEMEAALATYLDVLPDSDAKSEGIKLGEAVAAKILEARANDGANAPDTYRPRTTPGVYVPTVTPLAAHWPGVKPFALTSASQFRRRRRSRSRARSGQPIITRSRSSAERSAPSARHDRPRTPFLAGGRRQGLLSPDPHACCEKKLSLVDSARLFALAAVARADGLIAVFDAKYHYEFWRPVTAIRNGDIDDNPATERDAAWQPIDATPMHPEYPCAHCIESAASPAWCRPCSARRRFRKFR